MMERETLNFSAQKARDIIFDDDEEFVVVETEQIGNSRWSLHYRAIVHRALDDKYFAVTYSKGATEQQEQRPFDDEPPVFTQVFPTIKTITVYE
jgi:hypothetical protein